MAALKKPLHPSNQQPSVPPPPNISDFKFNTIGKPPKLLQRFSSPDKDNFGAALVPSNFHRDPADSEDRTLPSREPTDGTTFRPARSLFDRLENADSRASDTVLQQPALYDMITVEHGTSTENCASDVAAAASIPPETVQSSDHSTRVPSRTAQAPFLLSTTSTTAPQGVVAASNQNRASSMNSNINDGAIDDSACALIEDLKTRLHAMSSFTFPSLEDTRPLMQPIYEECALATKAAQKACSQAERSLASAHESIESARESLGAAESAKARANEAVQTFELLRNDLRQHQQRWTETIASTTADLEQLNTRFQEAQGTIKHLQEAAKVRNDHQAERDAAKEIERRKAGNRLAELIKEKEKLHLEIREANEKSQMVQQRTAEIDAELKSMRFEVEMITAEFHAPVDVPGERSDILGSEQQQSRLPERNLSNENIPRMTSSERGSPGKQSLLVTGIHTNTGAEGSSVTSPVGGLRPAGSDQLARPSSYITPELSMSSSGSLAATGSGPLSEQQASSRELASTNQPKRDASYCATSMTTPETINNTSSAILANVRQQQASQAQTHPLPLPPIKALPTSQTSPPNTGHVTSSPAASSVHLRAQGSENITGQQPAASTRVSSEIQKFDTRFVSLKSSPTTTIQVSVKQETLPDSVFLGNNKPTGEVLPPRSAKKGASVATALGEGTAHVVPANIPLLPLPSPSPSLPSTHPGAMKQEVSGKLHPTQRIVSAPSTVFPTTAVLATTSPGTSTTQLASVSSNQPTATPMNLPDPLSGVRHFPPSPAANTSDVRAPAATNSKVANLNAYFPDRMGPDLADDSGWARIDSVPSPTFSSDGDRHSRSMRKEGRLSDHYSPPADENSWRSDSDVRDGYGNPSTLFNFDQRPVSPVTSGQKRHRDDGYTLPHAQRVRLDDNSNRPYYNASSRETPEIYDRSRTPTLETRIAPRSRSGDTYRPVYKRPMDSYIPDEDSGSARYSRTGARTPPPKDQYRAPPSQNHSHRDLLARIGGDDDRPAPRGSRGNNRGRRPPRRGGPSLEERMNIR